MITVTSIIIGIGVVLSLLAVQRMVYHFCRRIEALEDEIKYLKRDKREIMDLKTYVIRDVDSIFHTLRRFDLAEEPAWKRAQWFRRAAQPLLAALEDEKDPLFEGIWFKVRALSDQCDGEILPLFDGLNWILEKLGRKPYTYHLHPPVYDDKQLTLEDI